MICSANDNATAKVSPLNALTTSDAESTADHSSGGASVKKKGTCCLKDFECLKKPKQKGCLRKTTCLKKSARKNSPAFVKPTVSSVSEAYPAVCLKAKPKKKKSRRAKTVWSGSSDKSESTAANSTDVSFASPSSDTSEDVATGASLAEGATTNTSTGDASSANERDMWTLSQDYALRGMKESGDGLTWAEIAATLGRDRSDVKARWIIIKDQPRSLAVTDRNMSKRRGEKNEEEDGNGKPSKRRENEVHRQEHVLSGEEESSEPSTSSNDSHDSDEEECRQARYLQRTIRSQLFPGSSHMEPSRYFPPQDCQILATAESKYRCSRWLEMQANFYNATGRMLPLHIIRDECERAERGYQRAEMCWGQEDHD